MFIFVIHYNITIFNKGLEITYIDVGQGDSIFIKFPNDKSNILIDTGGKVTYGNLKNNYSVGKNIVDYLKSMGIRKLDYLIITHGDFDHMGDSLYLIDKFKVENVIFNCGEFNALEKELIKKLKNSGTKKSDNGKNIYVDKDINYIEVEGYKKVYKIDSYSYNSSKENRTIDETFSNIEINTQESNYSIEANILPLINEYVNHENEMNNYSEENNELKLDENKKIILERLILEYDDTTKNVSYYNMSGYLLEK